MFFIIVVVVKSNSSAGSSCVTRGASWRCRHPSSQPTIQSSTARCYKQQTDLWRTESKLQQIKTETEEIPAAGCDLTLCHREPCGRTPHSSKMSEQQIQHDSTIRFLEFAQVRLRFTQSKQSPAAVRAPGCCV